MEKKSKKSLSCRKVFIRHLRIFVSIGTVNEREKIRRSRITNFRDDRPLCYNGMQAFTLIELLVVVLIIGILAAVALPQYQVTVEKARMTDSLVLLQKLKDAQERYYLANNKYATDLEELDITMPGILSSNNISLPNGLVLKLSHTDNYAYIENKKRTNALIMYYTYSPNHGQRRCSAKQGNSVANQVCKSLGGIWLLNATGCSIGDCSVYKLSD